MIADCLEPSIRIELMTSPLPRGCSTTELAGRTFDDPQWLLPTGAAKPHISSLLRGEAPNLLLLGARGEAPVPMRLRQSRVRPGWVGRGGAPFGTCSRGAGAEPPITKRAKDRRLGRRS